SVNRDFFMEPPGGKDARKFYLSGVYGEGKLTRPWRVTGAAARARATIGQGSRGGTTMNVWAVIVAAVSSSVLGGLWYSPALFGKVWNRENGGAPQDGHPAKVFGVAFLFSLVAAFAFAWWLGPAPALERAVSCGLVAGFGIAAASFGINYQFAQRSFLLWAIDGGYHTAQFALFGLILGAWH